MTLRTALSISGLALVSMLGACGGPATPGESLADIRSNPSPELDGMATSDEEIANAQARTVDTNLRMLNDDWQRLWLLDKPSMLTTYPSSR
jgi:hypothetical protein